MSRQNMIYVFAGQIGSGKTDNTKSVMEKIYSSNSSIDKMVVYDDDDNDTWHTMETWNHSEWKSHQLPIVNQEQLLRLKSGRVRYIGYDFEKDIYDLSQLRNTVLLIEDSQRFITNTGQPTKHLRHLLLNVKQRNIELILIFHSLMDIPSWLARICRIIILHHTEDHKCPTKFSNPKIAIAFNKLKEITPEAKPFFNIAIPINVNLKATSR